MGFFSMFSFLDVGNSIEVHSSKGVTAHIVLEGDEIMVNLANNTDQLEGSTVINKIMARII